MFYFIIKRFIILRINKFVSKTKHGIICIKLITEMFIVDVIFFLLKMITLYINYFNKLHKYQRC
jgi:hypothetical protein